MSYIEEVLNGLSIEDSTHLLRSELLSANDGKKLSQRRTTLLINRYVAGANGLFSEAFMHELYAPLSGSEIDGLEAYIGKTLPDSLRKLYAVANGFLLYFGSLSFHGLAGNRSQKFDCRSPISLAYGNSIDLPFAERFADPPLSEQIRVGFYAQDPGYDVVLFCNGDSRVGLYARDQADQPIRYWSCLDVFLASEIERFEFEFMNMRGRCGPLRLLSPPILDTGPQVT